MAWYRRSKLGWDMFRNLALGSKQPFNCRKVSTSCLDDVGFLKKKSSCGLKCYYALAVMGLAASGGYLSHLETIPYSRRTRLILVPRPVEKAFSEKALQLINKEHEGKILPATHPTSVRVGRIAKNIIDALQWDLSCENHNHNVDVWGYWKLGNIKSHAARYLQHFNWQVVLVEGVPGRNIFCGADKIVLYTGLLKDLNSDAEIAAVIAHEVACNVARSSAEIGTKISRVIFFKVLSAVLFGKSALPEKILSWLVYFPLCRNCISVFLGFFGCVLLTCSGYGCPHLDPLDSAGAGLYWAMMLMLIILLTMTLISLILEADYIGLLLMASVGYDPRVGVKLMEKQAKYGAEDNSYWTGFFQKHPSPKKRFQNLSQAKTKP